MQSLTKLSKIEMSFIMLSSLLVLLLSISAFSARIEAKPLNQNQVKFRRLPPKEFSVAIGSSITIECEAGGSPAPTIHWLKDGRRIIQNDFDENQLEEDARPIDDIHRIGLSSTRSRLFIDCADVRDEAVYTCVAENAYSRIATNTKLNIIKPLPLSESELIANELVAMDSTNGALNGPLSTQDSSSSQASQSSSSLSAVSQCLNERNTRASQAEPVRIHMWTHNIIEIMKNDIVLYCRHNVKREQLNQSQKSDQSGSSDLDGGVRPAGQQQQSRRPKISWTLPDEKVVDLGQAEKYQILDSGDLLIKDLRWADMGSYVCTVSDDQSSDSVSSFVYPASSKGKQTSKRGLASTSQSLLYR